MLDEQPFIYIDEWVPNPAWVGENPPRGMTIEECDNEVKQFVTLIDDSRKTIVLD